MAKLEPTYICKTCKWHGDDPIRPSKPPDPICPCCWRGKGITRQVRKKWPDEKVAPPRSRIILPGEV